MGKIAAGVAQRQSIADQERPCSPDFFHEAFEACLACPDDLKHVKIVEPKPDGEDDRKSLPAEVQQAVNTLSSKLTEFANSQANAASLIASPEQQQTVCLDNLD